MWSGRKEPLIRRMSQRAGEMGKEPSGGNIPSHRERSSGTSNIAALAGVRWVRDGRRWAERWAQAFVKGFGEAPREVGGSGRGACCPGLNGHPPAASAQGCPTSLPDTPFRASREAGKQSRGRVAPRLPSGCGKFPSHLNIMKAAFKNIVTL